MVVPDVVVEEMVVVEVVSTHLLHSTGQNACKPS
jgi:hypothetical protein